MTSTHDTLERYQELPISGVASNEPYAVGPEKADAVERQIARDEFIENGVDWPELNFPMLNAEDLKSAERSLTTLLMDIIADPDTEGAVKDIAYEQIALKLAEVYRHLEVVRGLGSAAVAKRELSRDRAGAMTMEIFGEPQKDVFDQLIAEERRANMEQLHSSDPIIAQAARDYLALTGAVEAPVNTSESSFELEIQTGEVVLQDLKELFPGLDEFLDQVVEQPVSPEESLAYFDQVLSIAGLTEKGWKTELSEGRAVGTDGPTKRILVGGNRAAFSPAAIKGVPVHEAIVHALRYQNAIEQEEPLKRRALPGNLHMEEGLGTSLEQIVTGERRVAGKPYYISLGLQLSLDHPGEPKRDFHQTHEIMWRRLLIERRKDDREMTEADVRKAKEDAYQTVIRTTRGNSLDARDISYFEGGRKANKWLNEIAQLPKEERQEKLRWVLSGKFDPTNPIHANLFDGTTQTD